MSAETAAGPSPSHVKDAHRAMWARGDYPAVADRLIPDLGGRLVTALGVGPDDRVLDVAAGSGNASLPAARAGARVTASDLTPELLDAGRRRAADTGLDLAWEVADAEALPYDDASFDVVMSSVGVMFAPRHETAAAELLRVCRPGGRVGVLSWTPDGFVGRLLATLRPWAPAPPPGASPPPLWGTPGHVGDLFGDGVTDLTHDRGEVVVEGFTGPTEFREYFAAGYGPMLTVYRSTADDPEQRAALEEAVDALVAEHDEGGGTMRWSYLLSTATRA
ncbi:methyltransferase domain-containing protein [Phycicoccus sp. BSK3Z-2]|uniref:Methyltransferase domain-containing protein n=1 Tax=Phycicoccus avicenniae TaxID=2828860 RepID=A0A941DAU5_9MICO|nr:methyltransferase domain-containing protein [Phycicoccus avicenniae]MBR7744288.1 methyltransferase domain-containing protein [Phycicoccus avicenniae]